MGFFAKAQTGCQAYFYTSQSGQVVQFHDTSYSSTPLGGSITAKYFWTFGDGQQDSVNKNPVHTYANYGTYTACLKFKVYQSGVVFCTDSFCKTITINCANPPVVTVVGNTLINAGQSTTLKAIASGGTPGYSYVWSNAVYTDSNKVTPSTTTTYCVTVYDNLQCSATYCQPVQVNTVNLKPLAADDTTCTQPNSSVTLNVLLNDTKLDTFPSVSILGTSTGTAVVNSNKTITYSPTALFNGTAIIYYKVCNYNGLCDTGKISIGVTPNCVGTNHAPVAQAQTYQTCNSNSLDILLAQFTSDPDLNDSLSYSLVTTPTSGNVTFIDASTLFYTPTPSYRGQVFFNYSVCDNGTPKLCDTGSIYIFVDTCGGSTSGCKDTLCGEVFNDTNGNGVKDAGENGIANSYVYAGNYTGFTDTFGHYEIVVPCGTNYIYAYPNPGQNCCVVTTVPLSSIDSSGLYIINDTSGTRICGFNFGYQNSGVTISGYIYLDANNNGIKDAGENVLPYQSVSIGGYYAYTDQYGYYVINMPAGTYTLTCTPYSPYAGATVNPASINLTATTVGATYPNNNFGLYIPQGVNLAVTISQYSTVAPGFPAYYYVDVCNVGTVTTGGVASLYYDSELQFSYSSPAQSSHNTSSHTLTWNVPALAPGDCQGYYVKFTLPATVALGTHIFNLATVTSTINPDINLTNNKDTIHQIVQGSWDPNNKLANGSYTHPETSTKFILPNTDLEYTINFQNTGTAPAVNVIVKDALLADLDANSFKLLRTSHDCQVIRDGSNLNFKFSNIMLPDSFHNEKESHGFVRFSVKPKTAALGTVINNTAQIFFDFNDAVVTNTTENIIAVSTGINDDYSVSEIVVAPNPFSSYTTISVKGVAAESIEMTTFDVTGRLVSSQIYSNPDNMRFERNGLNQGVYIYQLKQQGKFIGKGKLVIE
jgi:uncharacterized repeat protein (TIGR01451 family)